MPVDLGTAHGNLPGAHYLLRRTVAQLCFVLILCQRSAHAAYLALLAHCKTNNLRLLNNAFGFDPHSLPPLVFIRLRCPVAFAIDYGFTSSPYDGWVKVPSILMGTISPAFFFLKNGSTDLSRTDFTPFDPLESLLSTCRVP